MSTRRDFLTLVAAAIAGSAVLPIAARAKPVTRVRDDREAEFLALVRTMTPEQREAFCNAMIRYNDGVPIKTAVLGMYADLSLPVPPHVMAKLEAPELLG